MRNRNIMGAVALALSLVGPGVAAEPKAVIKGPEVWYQDWTLTLRFNGTISDEPASVVLQEGGPEDPSAVDFIPTRDPRGRLTHAMVVPGKTGLYRFSIIARGTPEGGTEVKTAVATLDVQVIRFGDPVPPKPPTPIPPTPVPPKPTPTPDPAPIPIPTPPTPTPPTPQAGTFRALILHQDYKMTRGQLGVFNSGVLVDRLNAGTMKEADGKASWRKLDVDTPILGDDASVWAPLVSSAKDALSKPGAHPLPVLVIYQGENAFVYPLPDSIAGLNSILAKYGS